MGKFLQELSKKTYGAYVKKAVSSAGNHNYKAGSLESQGDDNAASKTLTKALKRERGIGRATNRLTNEENDPRRLGYGHAGYEDRKVKPANPHPKGSKEHEGWNKEFQKGVSDREREWAESIEQDDQMLDEAKLPPADPKTPEGRKRLHRQYNRNENQNRHSENAVLLAKHFGTPEEHAKAQDLLKQRNKLGHAPDESPQFQYDMSKKHYHKLSEETLTEDMMSHEAHELVLHGDNTEHLYRQSHQPIMDNLRKKMKKGTYDPHKAKKLWGYHADRAAQDYHREHGSKDTPWHKMFTPKHRQEAAAHWEAANRGDLKEGLIYEKKIDPVEAREILDSTGSHGKDFHTLRSSTVGDLVAHAKRLGYRKSASAPGSTGRMFHQHLHRLIGEETLIEGLRLLGTYKNGDKTSKVYKDHEWQEHRVKLFHGGVHQTEADYHTDAADDAHSTAKSMIGLKEAVGDGKRTTKPENVYQHQYSKSAVDKEIRKDKRIGGREAKLIHRLLKGRQQSDEPVNEAKKKPKMYNDGTDSDGGICGSKKFTVQTEKPKKKEKPFRDAAVTGNPRDFAKEELVTELSKKTLGSYINKAAGNAVLNAKMSGSNRTNALNATMGGRNYRVSRDAAHSQEGKFLKRRKGIKMATDRLTKEELVTELSDKTMKSYLGKAENNLHKDCKKDSKKGTNRLVGMYKATLKMKEDTLTELSKKTLGNYVRKAAQDRSDSAYSAGIDDRAAMNHTGAEKKKFQDRAQKGYRQDTKRAKGIMKAVGRLTKEETITESLPKNASASTTIKDFVHSKNKKFKGDDTKQRIKRGLAAFYSAKKN